MAQRVAAIFATRAAAERAADALVDLGASREHVSMLSRGEEGMVTTTTPAAHREGEEFVEPAREVGDSGAPLTTADEDDASRGAATGAAIGAVAGLAAGAMALLVPGFGLVLAAGPLAWALGGAAGTAAAGAIAGGVFGGLRDVGIEESHARSYEERIRTGDVLLTALVPSVAEDRVLDILSEYGAEDVSFADDTSIAQMPVSPAAAPAGAPDATWPHRSPESAATASPEVSRMDTRRMTTPSMSGTTETPAAGAPPMAAIGGTEAPAGYNPDIVRGEAKQREGEWRDRAADATASPFDDVAAKGKKLEGKIQEEWGEAKQAMGAEPADRSVIHPDRTDADTARTASYAESPVGATATTGADFDRAGYNANIARGEAKQVEGELRDRAADRTASPMDDLAAKAKKVEGKAQEKIGEAEETIEPRRPL